MNALALPLFEQTLARRAWRTVLRLKLALVDRRKYQRTVLEQVGGLTLVVPPDVFNPKLLRSGAFLVDQVQRPDLVPVGGRVLDLGCGSGAAGLAAARRGCDVIATDINMSAARCTRANALLNNVAVEVREGDLFEPVAGDRFDVVLFNPPYYRGQPRDALDQAWRSVDVMDRFALRLGGHLTANGHALVVLSSDGDGQAFLATLAANGFRHAIVARRDLLNEVLSVYLVSQC